MIIADSDSEVVDGSTDHDIKQICCIGGGPAGLAMLKAILDTPQFKSGLWKPTLFEERENIGGVWLPAPPINDPPLTALYDSLTTNLPHPVMCYTSFPFPPSSHVFPHASYVQAYLESYAAHFSLYPHIRPKTQVQAVERKLSRWQVRVSSGETLEFDLVVVANGHYRVPRYPDTPGVDKWLEAKKASHSAWYRHSHNLGNTVLIVGGGSSGNDISAEMRTVTHTVIHSVPGAIPQDSENIKRRGRVVEFKDDGEVVFEDGTIETGIDYCILATGFQVSLPFFPSSIVRQSLPPPSPPLPRELYNSTFNVFPLAKHIFPLQCDFPASSLAFMGLLVRVAPLPLLEAQAHAIVHVFEHPEALNISCEAAEILARYKELEAEFGQNSTAIADAWHVFKDHEQFDYRDQLYKFAECSEEGRKVFAVSDVEKEMYDRKDVLRKFWKELVKRREADNWVKGVGDKNRDEWWDLLTKLLHAAEAPS